MAGEEKAQHVFPVSQAAYLRAWKAGRHALPAPGGRCPRAVSLIELLPPVHHQALRGTCVSAAVTALAEYYGDCRMRLSVQYLYAAAKRRERAALERNLARLEKGEPPLDAAFEAALHGPLLQLNLLAEANGGMQTPTMRSYFRQFAAEVRERFAADGGSLLKSCFDVLEQDGICRDALWPYAAAPAAPVFGREDGEVRMPPGVDDDARKRRILSGLYRLSAPNNVEEIRGVLAGLNERRPMPVCVTVDFFEGCDGDGAAKGVFALPETAETEDGMLTAGSAWKGRHGVLLAGYCDDSAYAGGGYFIVRNSLGPQWGEAGYGKMPYAYLECFALEAGTILQSRLDYEGDDYGGLMPRPRATRLIAASPRARHRLGWVHAVAALLLAGVTWFVARSTAPVARPHFPFADVTVYGTGGVNAKGILPPWNVVGRPIDGGYVYRVPVRGPAEVEAVRAKLGENRTLHEKRGKPLTYDVLSLFELRADDRQAVQRAVADFMAEGFPVRRQDSGADRVLVSTLNPRGFQKKLARVFHVREEKGTGPERVLTLTPRQNRTLLLKERNDHDTP
jgi:hypothetical protein